MSGSDEELELVDVVDPEIVDGDSPAAAPGVAVDTRPDVPTDVPDSWVAAMRLAARIHATSWVPRGMRGDPATVLGCFLAGQARGLDYMDALEAFDVIDGRPSLKPQWMRALVNRAGHLLTVEEKSSERVTLYGRRRDTGAEERVTWTFADAQRAKLVGNPSWTKYPRAMLIARATSELCRDLFPDVIGGLYTPEEVASISGSAYELDPVEGAHEEDGSGAVVPSPARDVEQEARDAVLREIDVAHDPGLARRIHAEIARTFPGASTFDRDRRRHALVAVVTRRRPEGPVWSSTDLDLDEQVALSDLLVRIQAGEASVVEMDAHTLQVRSRDRLYVVHEDVGTVRVVHEQMSLDDVEV